MPVWIVIGVAAAIFVLVFVVAATFNVFSAETLDEAEEPWTGLPEGFTGADLEAVTFRPALRGYRMEDVDEAMQMLSERLRELESAHAEDSRPNPSAVDSADRPNLSAADSADRPNAPAVEPTDRPASAHSDRGPAADAPETAAGQR
ncbi:DivIVA domain-containing protein [Brevibacterium renqingii]|uniref:DivIVA domain-containing protein n=1 Tax=Brevibacterium renqingii TaxID=2776916 RepID=UPI001ADF55B4|nr:DivIVA domain-containing protein [Brevibacterium renqingii]